MTVNININLNLKPERRGVNEELVKKLRKKGKGKRDRHKKRLKNFTAPSEFESPGSMDALNYLPKK